VTPKATLPTDTDERNPQPAVLRVVVDHLSAMVAYWDSGQRCRFANRAYEKWFGVDPEAMIGRSMSELLGPLYPLNLPYIEGALRGEPQQFERVIPDPAGGAPRHSLAEYMPDIVDGKVQGFCVLVTDITRLKEAESKLLEVERRLQARERLAGLATLAAGIAHEINNPLAAVVAHTDLALESLSLPTPDPVSLSSDLTAARENALRVRSIVQSMKLLARGDTGQRETVDVNGTLEMSLDVLASSIRHRARIELELDPALYIEGNQAQLAQVFVNLLTNAEQALPEGGGEGNEIRVTTRRDGELVVIEVADNGPGIPQALQAHIFEPFFTTKAVGGGMGLGLSLSSAIVKGFGGALSVASEPENGSVFKIELPAAASPAPARSEAPRPFDRPQPPAVRSAARPRVLVIDDEPALTKTLQRLLAQDCDVVTTNEGREAIALLVDSGPPAFDVILCDLMMPEPGGEAVYAHVTSVRPELAGRFVFITGGTFTQQGRHFLNTVAAPVLEKPFDLQRLRALVTRQAQ
jgi:PAS domain S-box-containing protein